MTGSQPPRRSSKPRRTVSIIGTGSYAPLRVLTNRELEKTAGPEATDRRYALLAALAGTIDGLAAAAVDARPGSLSVSALALSRSAVTFALSCVILASGMAGENHRVVPETPVNSSPRDFVSVPDVPIRSLMSDDTVRAIASSVQNVLVASVRAQATTKAAVTVRLVNPTTGKVLTASSLPTEVLSNPALPADVLNFFQTPVGNTILGFILGSVWTFG